MRDRAEASLNSVKAQLTQLTAQFRQIEQSFNRSKTLYEQKAISEAEYETALSQYNVTKEQIKAAEFNVKSSTAALKEAQENLTKTTIYAPMDGTISKLSVEKGERVVGTSQMAGTELLRIANFDQMEVLVDVNENDIIRIKDNDTASIEVDAYPDRKFTGVVTQIANSAKNIGSALEQVTNFEVKILILPESYSDLLVKGVNPFRPGMSATASIQTEKRTDIISIPVQTITTRSDLSKDTLKKNNEVVAEQVFVVKDDNSLEVRVITTGIQDITNIEVLTGLKEGERIVTGPYSAISKTLKADSKVTWGKEDKKKSDKKKVTETK
jgi:HlyD family secretion protein